ncbi:MAG TPA: redox-sensing transcriptional repressor Rex [bacterium]|nr:redox-sensing transcriptional repressor Rex [bacterium]
MSSPRKVTETTVRRLSVYYRVLQKVLESGNQQVSSEQLAELSQVSPPQVRRDLTAIGNFGVRGHGYDAESLKDRIAAALGVDRVWRAVVVGAGRLGSALTSYREFRSQGFQIIALFDSDPAKIGGMADGYVIRPAPELAEYLRAEDVAIGIITTPPSAAQEVANILVAGGVRGILNFAPAKVHVPAAVRVRDVNLTFELEGLTFAITEENNGGDFSGFEAA